MGRWNVAPATVGAPNPPSFYIEFKGDHTFAMTMFMAMEGTYQMTGHTVKITPTKMGGVELPKGDTQTLLANEPGQFTLSDDGKTLTMGKDMKFVKAH